MWSIYVAGLIIGLYLAPALAIVPRVAFDSRLAFVLPIVSVLVVTTCGRVLKALGLFDHQTVLFITLGFVAVAAYRLWALNRSKAAVAVITHWPIAHRLVYLFATCMALPMAARLGTSGFEVNDEIYSWNLWAVQHVRGEPPDFFYTGAPYPQTFSYLIAWSYCLLGSIDLQLPVRFALAVLSMSLIAAVGTVLPKRNTKALLWFICLMVFALIVTPLRAKGLYRGLAEALMIPALAVSAASYLHYRTTASNIHIWMSSVAAVVAGLTKQPALLWLMLGLPALMVAKQIRQRQSLVTLAPVAMAWCAGLLWLATEGVGFHHNKWVVARSQEGRSWGEQLLYASNEYVIDNPAIGVILALCIYAMLRDSRGRGVFFLLLVPSLLLWFLFGAYEERLGMHVVALATLLIAASSLTSTKHDGASGVSTVRPGIRFLIYGIAFSATAFAAKSGWTRVEDRSPHFSFYDGGKNVIYKYFGADADFVYREIYRQKKMLWIPSAYIYGIFYGHNPIIRPDHRGAKLTKEKIEADIASLRPDYLFDSGDRVAHGPASGLLRELVEECGDYFEAVASGPNKFGYTIYQLNDDAMELGCRQ